MTGIIELSIVIPVYNEADNIRPTLDALRRAAPPDSEILVVFDFPEDTTIPVVRELQPEMPNVHLVHNDLGRGALNAIKTGFGAARGAYVLVTMADGSDDLSAIDTMLELARTGPAIVAPSRYMPGGKQLGGPLLKRTLSRLAGLSLHYVGRVGTHDATNNFKLYRRSFLDSVDIESTGGFELALELTTKAALNRERIVEVPTTWRDRTAGQSRFRLRAWLPRYLRWYLFLFRGRLVDIFRNRRK